MGSSLWFGMATGQHRHSGSIVIGSRMYSSWLFISGYSLPLSESFCRDTSAFLSCSEVAYTMCLFVFRYHCFDIVFSNDESGIRNCKKTNISEKPSWVCVLLVRCIMGIIYYLKWQVCIYQSAGGSCALNVTTFDLMGATWWSIFV